ncbi:VWA domain-containing protein [Poseidonocella sp. HB161398]|uniref:VWA domain-containing protein n=1 Tax=Poseidonocella sp. HB161398 TaxID=2320855 RepID=UPI0011093D84|nr:VWA domain-containing protein [Poseidonocella sp. HB161398]
MSLAAPWVLLLLPLPLLLAVLLPPRKSGSGALYLPPALAAAFRPAAAAPVRRHARLIALGLAWIALVAALAGPRQERVLDLVPASGRDIILALDLSGSMEREDFMLDGRTVSRLAAVQAVAAQFVRGRAGDRVGLVVFGDRAYVVAAPTHDVAAVAEAIGTLQIGVSGKATAIADGLGLAIRRLRAREAESRVILLLSDGQDTTGLVDPVAAARAAGEMGMRVYTIALGPGEPDGAGDAREAVDTETLRRIAGAARGESFRVRTTGDLEAVAAAMNRLEPSPSERPPVRTWRLFWPWPAALAAAGLALAMLLQAREAA